MDVNFSKLNYYFIPASFAKHIYSDVYNSIVCYCNSLTTFIVSWYLKNVKENVYFNFINVELKVFQRDKCEYQIPNLVIFGSVDYQSL